MAVPTRKCWICESTELVRVRESQLPERMSGEHFRITDSAYGTTAAIDRCAACGFHQCTDMVDVLGFYEEMSDSGYEASRAARALQERALLNSVRSHHAAAKTLLDVGAGSGIMVEEARKLGLRAEGVEPSASLAAHARELGIPVHHGVLPLQNVGGPYDLVTLVDVVEHVPDPVGLLAQLRAVVSADGLVAVVTPDRRSLMARLLGFRWWHYRIAHIGYFSRSDLETALRKAGLEPVGYRRPTWFFPLGYILDRLMVYLPKRLRFRPPAFADRLTVPLNLFDSMMILARPAASKH